jgi:extradiol dioxygenase family protein
MTFPDNSSELTHILVVADTVASKTFYINLLGAELYSEYGSSIVLKFLGCWILLVEPGGPTKDKPDTNFVTPQDIQTVSSSFTIKVNDCIKIYKELKRRGVSFVTPPVKHGHETRAFFTDLDNHLFEISQYSPVVNDLFG